jgi:glyceraldehyde-3-phosphate dehydrogenase (NADP+)
MDRQKGNLLVTDPRIAVLSFTGSPEVGWKMKNNAGKKKVILELGGNAGVIISSKDDIEQIVSKCISGAFSYSGQVCIHTQRIFVLQNIFQEFIDLFSKKISTLIAGNPIDSMTDISVMIDEDNAIRVETWIADAVAGGATLVCGGNRKGNYVEPALLTGTHPEMQVCADEIFGPVVVVEPVNTFSEAIELINSGRFGLQAGVFTNNISEMNQAFNRLKVGGVIINDIPTFRVDHMPYGGVKDSGTGREGVKYAMLDMMEPRLLVKNSLK